ncbi:uncharacterized protein METZ01_LOCUS475687, partial [marine metagenome]
VKTQFEGSPVWIIVFCNEAPKTLDQIQAHLREKGIEENRADTAKEVVFHLEEQGILYRERGKYLTLVQPHSSNLCRPPGLAKSRLFSQSNKKLAGISCNISLFEKNRSVDS